MPEILLIVKGRLTLGEAQAELARQLALLRAHPQVAPAGSSPRVVGDLSGLTELDTSALSVLLHLDRESRARFQVPILWRGAPENLLSLARLTSLLTVLQWEGEPR